MDKNIENIKNICEKEQIDWDTIPHNSRGLYLKINEGDYNGDNRNYKMEEEKIFLVEIGKNIVYRMSYTKNKIDIFCQTEQPTVKKETTDAIEKELAILLNKKRLENLY